jgi:DNA primase
MAGIIPPHKLEEIRAASDIVEVVGGYLPLRKAGANFVALCPFHHEKTPSFNVNPGRQIFHCFGCQKGGDVFTFVQEYERLTFIEAVRRLAERAHIELEFAEGGQGREERNLRDRLRDLHEALALRWHHLLKRDPVAAPAREYLARRGVPDEAVERFRLGYAPPDGRDTVRWARQQGHELELLEQGGLLLRADDGAWYGRFRGRLMFPINDPQGRVVGFSGRLIEGDERKAKYVNSPETPLFHKGRVIYGLDRARRAVLDSGQAVLCEGQLDTIACHLAGIENVVAPQGTALTADHCRLLRRYAEEVVLCFDSDAAGQKAVLRSLDELLASGLAIRVATVPAPHDPDSFIREHGGPAFQKLLDEARGFFDFLLDHLCATNDLHTDRGRAATVRLMAESALKTGNPVTIDRVIRRTAERLGLHIEAVRQDFRRHSARSARRPRSEPPAPDAPDAEPPALPRPGAAEFWLLRILLADDDLVPWAADNLEPGWIEHPVVREVVQRRFAAAEADDWAGVPALLDTLETPGARQLVTEALAQAGEIPNRVRQLMDIVARLELGAVDRELRALRRQLAEPGALSPDEIAELQQRSVELVRRRLELRAQFSRTG